MDIIIQNLPKRRYRTKQALFKKFHEILPNKIQDDNITFKNITTKEEFQEEYKIFLHILQDTCDQSLKKKSSTFKRTITWWTNELRVQRNYKKSLYRKTKLPSAILEDILKYKNQRAQYKREILKARKHAWTAFCSKEKIPMGRSRK